MARKAIGKDPERSVRTPTGSKGVGLLIQLGIRKRAVGQNDSRSLRLLIRENLETFMNAQCWPDSSRPSGVYQAICQ
jgi:hypothetical protein